MENIKPCKCQHAYQDDAYGPSLRVFNKFNKGWRCTVCGAEKIESTGGKK